MQISLADHLTECDMAMQRMSAKNPHRRVIDVSAQLLIQLAEQLREARLTVRALESDTTRLVVTDPALTRPVLGAAEPSPARDAGPDAQS